MKRRIRLRLSALADIDEGRLQFERVRDGLGARSKRRSISCSKRSKTFPNYGRIEGDVRAAYISRFRYVVYYRVLSDVIDVFAALPGKRRPEEWKRRI